MWDRFNIFYKPSVTSQMQSCSQVINPLSTTTVFANFFLVLSAAIYRYRSNYDHTIYIGSVYLHDRFRLPVRVEEDAYI
jgi:hypothetical protein